MSTELVVLTLLAAVLLLLVAADKLRLPFPILLVIGGLGLGLLPGIPDFRLEPDVVFLIVLPPLLYSTAFFSSLRELRANLRSISLLAVGLVLATATTVGIVAHEVIGIPWAAAFVLGAVVSPTDPIAATAIAQRLSVPRRVITILEGESLVNDASALVTYRVAVAAVLSGSFSLLDASGRFALNVSAGLAIGLAVGWVVAEIRKRLDNPPLEMAISVSTAYFAYLPAQLLGVSGVVAAVTAGVYLGWRSPELTVPATRIQLYGVWEMLVFFLNAFLFIMVGLQLPTVVDALSGEATGDLVLWTAVVCGTVIVTRLVWVPIFTYLPRWMFPRIRERDPYPPWQGPVVVAWAGMRGAVSLAAALALPLETDAGTAFPFRDLIIFLTFAVILATLLIQGLTLPALIRMIGLGGDDDTREEAKARIKAARAAIERLDELALEEWTRDDTIERMRGLYEYRSRRFRARIDGSGDGEEIELRSRQYQKIRREALEAERRAVVRLRNSGVISEETMHRIERDLDLEDSRLEI